MLVKGPLETIRVLNDTFLIPSYWSYDLHIMRPCNYFDNILVAHRPQVRRLILTCPNCAVKWYHIPARGMLTRTTGKPSLLKNPTNPTSIVLFVISMFTAQSLVNAVWTWILQINEYDQPVARLSESGIQITALYIKKSFNSSGNRIAN